MSSDEDSEVGVAARKDVSPPEDFANFVRAQQGRLLRAAYLMTGDRDIAQDLLQEALEKLARKWHRVSGGDPTAYVRVCMYHDAISWRRQRARERLTQSPTTPSRDFSSQIDDHMALLGPLLAVPARQRAVVILRFFEDLSERETAEILGVSIGTVKSQCHAALARLRKELPALAGVLNVEEMDEPPTA